MPKKTATSRKHLSRKHHRVRRALHHHLWHKVPFNWRSASLAIASAVMLGQFAIKTYAASPVPIGPTGEWNMVFQDEFNANALDTARWATCYDWNKNGCYHQSNNELNWYDSAHVSVSDGSAHLLATNTATTGSDGHSYNYVSGMITTGRDSYFAPAKYSFQYGYAEARLKLPAGQGLWPAFWLLPADQTWPPEVDIMENLGHESNKAYMSYHWIPAAGGHDFDVSQYVGGDVTAWHTYGVDWQPGVIHWYIDGVVRKTYTNANVTSKSMYVLLNLAVGGDWPGNPDGTTVFPATMDIDYVRIWQKSTAPVVSAAPASMPPVSSSTINATPMSPDLAPKAEVNTIAPVIKSSSQPQPTPEQIKPAENLQTSSPISSQWNQRGWLLLLSTTLLGLIIGWVSLHISRLSLLRLVPAWRL
jgi:beta-glucanase (GH16 family)